MKTILKVLLVIELVLCVGCCTVPKETRVNCEITEKDDLIHPIQSSVSLSITEIF